MSEQHAFPQNQGLYESTAEASENAGKCLEVQMVAAANYRTHREEHMLHSTHPVRTLEHENLRNSRVSSYLKITTYKRSAHAKDKPWVNQNRVDMLVMSREDKITT